MTFEEAQELVMSHIRARKWDKTNGGDKHIGTKDDMASELANIIIYAIQFAARFNINIPEAVAAKIAKQAEKYPVEIFEIEDKAEQNRRWLEAKKNYKKDTTL